MHELFHGYLDISAEADGVLPAAVVEPVEEPQKKEISDVFRLEGVVAVDEGVCHAESHAAVVGPYTHLTGTRVKQTVLYCYQDIVKTLVDYTVALLIVW